MQFDLTEEQTLIQDTARQISGRHLAPHAEALDRGRDREHLLANLKRLAEAGFMGLNVSTDYGGSEAGAVAFAIAMEEFGRACSATAVTTGVTNMVAEVIQAVGSEDQKNRHIPSLCDGSYAAGSFCLTEAGAGSDPSGMKTRAVMDGNEWVLNGTKLFISSAEFAGLFIVWAVTDPQAPRGKGISCFLVEAGAPGLIIGKAEEKMGQHGSPTNEVIFDDCRVPADALMGGEGGGYRVAMEELFGGRIAVASAAIGIASAAMETAMRYITQREQFGRKIAQFQGIRWMVADAAVELDAARLLTRRAAWAKDQGRPFAREASMAKLYATEMAQRATYTALQLHGGAGYIRDNPLERFAREARVTTIYEGTSEIQRHIIAREVLKEFM